MAEEAQIRIDLDDATPVNRQIVEQLRTLMVEGAVAPGESLPSVRRLAIDLGVHFNTVADAYRVLAEEGWVEISHGRGARVCERKARPADDETLNAFRRRLRQLAAEMRGLGLSPASIVAELQALAEGMK